MFSVCLNRCRGLIVALVLLTAMALPSRAEIQINEVVVNNDGSFPTLRVKLMNPAIKTEPGPITVTLSVRQGDTDRWTTLATWNDIDDLDNGEKDSRTWQDPDNTLVPQLIASGRFEIRVKATAPKLPGVVEYFQMWPTPSP